LGRDVKVEIWSDVVCPWCYVGKRRFEAALAGFEHRDEVEILWRSFELDPSAPAERTGDGAARLAEKYGVTYERAQGMHQHMTDVAAEEGLELDFARARGGNTFDAHRLLHLAADRGRQHEVKERFLRGYFTEGEPIGQRDALVRLATDAGLEGDDVVALLDGDDYAEAVRRDEATAQALGATGVPFFVFDRAFAVGGAQSPDVFAEVLAEAYAAAKAAAPA
jgi:predicted DsbA family dithiol-disulfide isomerase